jgi:hypothetical protein
MTTLCRGLEEVVELDFEHLEGLSCLSITRIASKDHKVWLFGRLNLKNIKFQQDVFTRMDWWPVFDRLWKSHISKSTPTTVGKLIGILHHDSKTGQRTTIKW